MRTTRTVLALVAVLLAVPLALPAGDAGATVLCTRKKGGRVVARKQCRKKEIQLGAGEVGALAVQDASQPWGNGSAGARTVSADEDWSDASVAPDHLQFTDLRIVAGRTLTLPSGTVIRCTGTFTNEGNVVVLPGVEGGLVQGVDTTTGDAALTPAHPGVARSAAASGEWGSSAGVRVGGNGGHGLSETEARGVLLPGFAGGGGGGGALSSGIASRGGGTLVVLARTGIVNAAGAAIHADAESADRGGGGGGGVVVLASPGAVTNAGRIDARGSAGQESASNRGPSAGGGGGIVHLLSPSPGNTGTIDVSGGAAGDGTGNVSAAQRGGGGGGGACGGAGGSGNTVPAGTTPPNQANPGESGDVLLTTVDPTSLF
jgi:hypothetical protein